MSQSEEEEIGRIGARLVTDRSAARQAAEGGGPFDPSLWEQLVELGLIGMPLPESLGGVGLGLAEESALAEVLAKFVVPAPIVTTAAAAHVLAGDADRATDATRAAAQALIDGRRVGVALSSGGGLPELGLAGVEGAQGVLTGTIPDLFEGAALEALLVHAAGGWWLVDLDDPGVERRDTPSLDETKRLAHVTFNAVRATRVSATPSDIVLSVVSILLASEALGVAQAALDMTRDYLLLRHQFGQPIGRFQALKQKIADCLIATEAARSAVWGALRSVRAGRPDPTAASLAKAEAGRAGRFVVGEAVQMHGAIGCTWEHDLHLLLRRAKHCELSLGSPSTILGRLGESLIEDAVKHPGRRTDRRAKLDVGFVPSEEDEAFIAPFRSWLDEHAPPERAVALRRAGLAARRAWQAEMAEAGWVGIHWAKSAGGREASFTQQVLYYAELTQRGLPGLAGHRGLMLVGPTLIAHGTPEQKRLLEPTRRADILWAGGFSERGAGSDLASLRTRGEVDGDELVINGHKIWTSQAHYADWIYALIRTGPLHPKHAGISVVVLPMNTPGLECRPIRRNNGDFHFNEIFFDDVRVPIRSIVGEMNNGWRVNRTTMVGENLTNFLEGHAALAGTGRRIAREIGQREIRFGVDHDLRGRYARAWANTQIVGLHGLRNVARFSNGDAPAAESSISKLVGQENEKELFELMVDSMGSEGLQESAWTRAYLSTRASTIGGGTSEIHRNKLAERVLGMPRDPWADDE